jgi:hypothetical protein
LARLAKDLGREALADIGPVHRIIKMLAKSKGWNRSGPHLDLIDPFLCFQSAPCADQNYGLNIDCNCEPDWRCAI